MGNVKQMFAKEMKELNQTKSNGGLLAAKIHELIQASGATVTESATACRLLDLFYLDIAPAEHNVATQLAKLIVEQVQANGKT